MRHLVWIGAIAAGFGLGVAVGLLQRPSEDDASAGRVAVVAGSGERIADLERQFRERDSAIERLQARLEVAAAVKAAPAVAGHSAEGVPAPVNPEPSRDARDEVDESVE